MQTVAWLWFMERWVRRGHRRLDSPVTCRILGVGEVVSVWDPELVKQLFTGDSDVLHAGEANARVLGRVAPNSLLALDGARHVRMRRLLSPPFHGEAVRRYRQLIGELATAEVQRWPVGEGFAIYPRMQAIALEVILRAVIGVRDPARMARLRELLPKMAGASAVAFTLEARNPRLAGGWIGAWLPWVRARREAEVLLYEEIAAHRSDPDGREDILAGLMEARDENGEPLTDEELRDQLVTLLIAGQETTATALAWCFERLLRHPAVLARLERELAGGESDAYLDAVVNETLRVRPPLEGVWRKLTAPLELGGYLLPAGTIVSVTIISVHLSEVFPDAERFRPERFLDQPTPSYALIPFGGGSRRCIGASFALMEMKTILRTVLEHVELRAPTQKPERAVRTRRITTVPARGGRVLVTSRRPIPPGPSDPTVERSARSGVEMTMTCRRGRVRAFRACSRG
ncbi:MAG: cytochrome P450 [Solirubrobacteraceae bacterium]